MNRLPLLLILLPLLAFGETIEQPKDLPQEPNLVIITAPRRKIVTDTNNIIMPGDTIYITALGPSRITSSVQVTKDGNASIPFLSDSHLLLGYLTIPEAIAQIKGLILLETEKEYVVNVRKLQKSHER